MTSMTNPLQNLLPDAGYTGIFRTIACVGDSLSSGEFETVDENGQKSYHDLYEYSWGQYIARAAGSTVYNFSKGGMSARTYLASFGEERGFWKPELACQAYIFALGVNDITGILKGTQEEGSLADIDWNDGRNNRPTAVGDYAALLQRYREIAPDAYFFLMTIPRNGRTDDRTPLEDRHRDLLYALAEKFPNTFVLDFRRDAPVYDEAFEHDYFLYGHMNPMGYMLTAKMVMTYIDGIIRSDLHRFANVGLINTPWMKDAKK